MSKLQNYISFTKLDSATPTLIGALLFPNRRVKGRKISVYQAKLIAREYFDKIREWNRLQVVPDPTILIVEMALT